MTRAKPRASLLKKVNTYSNAPSSKRLERLCRALVVWLVSLCSSPTYAQSILAHKHERSRKWLESLITTWHDGIVNMMAAPQHPCHPVPLPLPASHGLPVEKRSFMTTPALSAALCSFVQSEFASERAMVGKLGRVIVAGVQEACRREMVSVFRSGPVSSTNTRPGCNSSSISDSSGSDGDSWSPFDEAHTAGHSEGVGWQAAGNSTGGGDPIVVRGGSSSGAANAEAPGGHAAGNSTGGGASAGAANVVAPVTATATATSAATATATATSAATATATATSAHAATSTSTATATSAATSELASELRDVGKDVNGATTLCVNAATNAATRLRAVESRVATLATKLSEQLTAQAEQASHQRARIQQLERKLQQLREREAGWKAKIEELQQSNESLLFLQKHTHRHRHHLSPPATAVSQAAAAAVSPAAAAAAAGVAVFPMRPHGSNGPSAAKNTFQLGPVASHGSKAPPSPMTSSFAMHLSSLEGPQAHASSASAARSTGGAAGAGVGSRRWESGSSITGAAATKASSRRRAPSDDGNYYRSDAPLRKRQRV